MKGQYQIEILNSQLTFFNLLTYWRNFSFRSEMYTGNPLVHLKTLRSNVFRDFKHYRFSVILPSLPCQHWIMSCHSLSNVLWPGNKSRNLYYFYSNHFRATRTVDFSHDVQAWKNNVHKLRIIECSKWSAHNGNYFFSLSQH